MKTKLTIAVGLAAVGIIEWLGADQPLPKQERTIEVSNIIYTVSYHLKSTNAYSVPLTNPLGQPHYDCTATIHAGTNRIGVIETQWTKDGCFEDSPMLLVGRALDWKRYPNNSAGTNLHWVVKGPAMWAEPDEPKRP